MNNQKCQDRCQENSTLKFGVKVADLMPIGEMTGCQSEKGATAVEYSLIVALIAGVIIGTVTIVGGQLVTLWESVQW